LKEAKRRENDRLIEKSSNEKDMADNKQTGW
jgi:hypothetical protein